MKIKNNYILGICVALLVVVSVLSITGPLRFDQQRESREQIVKQRLMAIRHAESHYLQRHGSYASSMQELVNEGLLADSLTIIPFSGERFEVALSTSTDAAGRDIPLMECGAQYHQYLSGMDGARIADLTAKASESGRYPGLKIGDLETPNNNAGNWE